jgi:hypothetical protein
VLVRTEQRLESKVVCRRTTSPLDRIKIMQRLWLEYDRSLCEPEIIDRSNRSQMISIEPVGALLADILNLV